jgi:glutaredoxin
VRFKEVDIERDPKAAQDLMKKTAQMGVPVIKIGSRWIVGSDQPRIERPRESLTSSKANVIPKALQSEASAK